MNLYVIRHGEVDLNAKKLLNGRNDSVLNQHGIKQAETSEKQLKNIDLDFIICSPLKRTVQTCELINFNKKVPVIYDDRIAERNTNSLMYKPDSSVDKNIFYNPEKKIIYNDCEGFGSIIDRVKNFLKDVKKNYENKNILLVTHGDVCEAIYCYINDIYDSSKFLKFYQQNCEIIKYIL